MTDVELEVELRECARCGCTDEEACEGGCEWAGYFGGVDLDEDSDREGYLCTRCTDWYVHGAPKKQKRRARA